MNLDTRPDNFLPDESAAQKPDTITFTDDDVKPLDMHAAEATPPESQHRHPVRKFLTWFVTLLLIALCVAVWLRYFNPYITDATVTGYVTRVERRGLIFKTFEADVTTRQAMADTSHIYHTPMAFTVPSDSLALRLQHLQGTGTPVTITYKQYYATVPWRGASKMVVTAVDR